MSRARATLNGNVKQDTTRERGQVPVAVILATLLQRLATSTAGTLIAKSISDMGTHLPFSRLRDLPELLKAASHHITSPTSKPPSLQVTPMGSPQRVGGQPFILDAPPLVSGPIGRGPSAPIRKYDPDSTTFLASRETAIRIGERSAKRQPLRNPLGFLGFKEWSDLPQPSDPSKRRAYAIPDED
jgi:hypothetical protein